MKKITVFDKNRFRVYVPYRKYLELENLLNGENIQYRIDLDMPSSISNLVRFYFKKEDFEIVEQILKKNDIQVTDDFYVPSDYKQNQKYFALYLKFFSTLLIFGLIILIIYIVTTKL